MITTTCNGGDLSEDNLFSGVSDESELGLLELAEVDVHASCVAGKHFHASASQTHEGGAVGVESAGGEVVSAVISSFHKMKTTSIHDSTGHNMNITS